MSTMSRGVVATAASLVLVLGVTACSDDDSDGDDPSTTTGADGDPGDEGDLLAESRIAAVAFFETQAVNDYGKALDASSGAAALTIDWAEGVNGIEAVTGTPYEVPAAESPNVRVQLDDIEAIDDDTYRASGFLELGSRPGGIASTTTSAAPGSEDVVPTTTFVIDLVLSGDAEELRVDDYRLDDVPYPVSELYERYTDDVTITEVEVSSDGDPTTTTEADTEASSDVSLELGHRNTDGSVQYLVSDDLDGATLVEAGFFAAEGDSSTTTEPPPVEDLGTPATVFADEADEASGTGDDEAESSEAGDGDRALVVRAGAFPGSAGTLRLVYEDDAGERRIFDVEVPEPGPLEQRPVDVVRDSQTASTTTSSSTTSSSTTTTQP